MAKNFGLVVVGGRPGDIVASGHERSLSELSRAGAGYVFNGAYTPLACRLVEEVPLCDGNCCPKMMPGEVTKRHCSGLASPTTRCELSYIHKWL